MFGPSLPIRVAMGSVIRVAAIVTSAIVLLGFGLFAVDEMDKGSRAQRQALGDVAPDTAAEQAREAHHGTVREVVDDANDVLLRPFSNLIDSDNSWVEHGVPALLALLVYGLGLGLLANLLPKQRTGGRDWRAVRS
jgi:hypothetical protein